MWEFFKIPSHAHNEKPGLVQYSHSDQPHSRSVIMGWGLTSLPNRDFWGLCKFFFPDLLTFWPWQVGLSCSDCGLVGRSVQLLSFFSGISLAFRVPLPHLAIVLVSYANRGRFGKALNGFRPRILCQKEHCEFLTSRCSGGHHCLLLQATQDRTKGAKVPKRNYCTYR